MIIIDTSTWIEYFTDSNNADFIEEILNNKETMTPIVVLLELSCKSTKENWNFNEYLNFIKSKSSIIGTNDKIIINCGKIYLEERRKKPSFSMIDATIWAIAQEHGAKILTKDNHFRDFEKVILLE